MKNESRRIGEIIEASTHDFIAQSYELYDLPVLGSLVKCEQENTAIYAITSYATTSSLEPGRRPIARGRSETSEEDIFKSHPQLTQLLRSSFNGIVVGHKNNDTVYQYLPPRPARLHSFVYSCNSQEVQQFSQSLDFLMLLANSQSEFPVEELISAGVRYLSSAYDHPEEFIYRAGVSLAELLSADYLRLKNILSRIKL